MKSKKQQSKEQYYSQSSSTTTSTQYFANNSKLGFDTPCSKSSKYSGSLSAMSISQSPEPRVKCKVLKDQGGMGGGGDYDHLIKIVIIGAPGAGKTSMMVRFIQNHFDESYISTIGVDFKLKTIRVGDDILKLQVWDTAGQERFRSITRSYYRNSHGCIAMFDLTDKLSFLGVEEMITEFINSGLAQSSSNIVLVGGKKDDEGSRKVSKQDAMRISRKYNIPYFEVSSKLNSGVEEVFFQIAYNAVNELQKQFKASGIKQGHSVDRKNTEKYEKTPTKFFLDSDFAMKKQKQKTRGCC